MSPRRNRARRDDTDLDEQRIGAPETVESHDGEPWVVRSIRGSSSTKTYRCPGCDHEIPPATPHVVAWPAEPVAGTGADQRRHWHTACWRARSSRRPGGRRG
jgi:hypothetical protein